MAKIQTSISQIEPHFNELLACYEEYKSRRNLLEIFDVWARRIKPDVPLISPKQWQNYMRYQAEKIKDSIIKDRQDAPIVEHQKNQVASLVEIESQIRGTTSDLLEEAGAIMRINKEDGVPLKERFFALAVVDRIWGKVQKEKEIAIKAHAEKRESVGMFAKLLRGALSGEFTMKDVELMKKNYGNTLPTTEPVSEGIAVPAN